MNIDWQFPACQQGGLRSAGSQPGTYTLHFPNLSISDSKTEVRSIYRRKVFLKSYLIHGSIYPLIWSSVILQCSRSQGSKEKQDTILSPTRVFSTLKSWFIDKISCLHLTCEKHACCLRQCTSRAKQASRQEKHSRCITYLERACLIFANEV